MEEVRPIGAEPIQYASIPGIKCNKLFEVVWDADADLGSDHKFM